MMKFTLLLAVSFITAAANAQSLKKYSVSNSGCSLYSYCESKYDVAYSKDSSKVFTGECTLGEVTYGIICIKLLISVNDLDGAEEMMISYADHLKEQFNIIKAAGYGKGHRLNNKEGTRGILDYWEDNELDKWKIKAWTDGKYIGFMYAYSKKELPEVKVNVFLESLRLPGMK
jgi:hypothetical protein